MISQIKNFWLSFVKSKKSKINAGGFTLLELLIVISIIAILSVALVFVLNPAETLKKSRDAQRISDLLTVKTALGLMLTSTSTPSLDGTFGSVATGICTTRGDGGAPTTLRIQYSVDSAPTATGVLTPGTDSAVSTAFSTTGGIGSGSAAAVDGTGWIPVNLGALIGGSPISNYPVDPTNTVSGTADSTDLVYRYACQNKSTVAGKPSYVFEINAQLESDAYTTGTDDKRAKDGGDHSTLYEVGTSLRILPTVVTF